MKAYTRDIRRQGEVEYHHLTHGPVSIEPKLGVDRAKDIRRQGEVEKVVREEGRLVGLWMEIFLKLSLLGSMLTGPWVRW